MDRLTELLNCVSDTYYDFVVCVLNYAKKSNFNTEVMIEFIENNPNALTSDILEFMIERDNYYDHAQRIADVSAPVQNMA